MQITITLDGIQEGKKYTLEFSVNGKSILTSPVKQSKKKSGPSLESFEKTSQKTNGPTLEEVGHTTKEFKIESSFEGKIDPIV